MYKPSYKNVPEEQQVHIPIQLQRGKYTIEKSTTTMDNCYSDETNDTLASRRFINNTGLRHIFVLDGATQQIVECYGTRIFTSTPVFKISVSIFTRGGKQWRENAARYLSNDCNQPYLPGIRVDVVDYIIQKEDILNGPVFIPELNLTITKDDYIQSDQIPTLDTILEEYKASVERWAKEMCDYPPFSAYVELPRHYCGSRRFYLSVNNTICILPILETSDYTLENPQLVIQYRTDVNKAPNTFKLSMENKDLASGVTTYLTDKYSWVCGTNYHLVSDMIDKEVAEYVTLKTTNKQLKEQIKTISEELENLTREHRKLLDDRKQVYDEFQKEKDEFREEKKEFYQQKEASSKWWGDALKAVGVALAVGMAKAIVTLWLAKGKEK